MTHEVQAIESLRFQLNLHKRGIMHGRVSDWSMT